MLRLTRQADYGIVLMRHMASDAERLWNAPDLAAEAFLPPPMVSKILKLLAKEGLLQSHRGVKGGYSLARASEEISMAQIITALEGPIAVTECIENSPGECVQEPVCPVRGHWQILNRAVRKALDEITLAHLVQPSPRLLVTLGGHHDPQERPGTLPVGPPG